MAAGKRLTAIRGRATKAADNDHREGGPATTVPRMMSRQVLVLNQNYEPMSVCTARRAFVLVFLGKAEVVEQDEQLRIHSAYRMWPLPSVVRLGTYIRVPQKRILLSRKNILKRDGHRCMYCGTSDGRMTVDHVVPRLRGGRDSWENLVCACHRCNNLKGNRTPDEARMPLRGRASRPNHITFIQRFIGIRDNRWRPYLFLD
jgi:5-methylcytosine-specific restriction endonuclease McrA